LTKWPVFDSFLRFADKQGMVNETFVAAHPYLAFIIYIAGPVSTVLLALLQRPRPPKPPLPHSPS
jgi:hypothetical protein